MFGVSLHATHYSIRRHASDACMAVPPHYRDTMIARMDGCMLYHMTDVDVVFYTTSWRVHVITGWRHGLPHGLLQGPHQNGSCSAELCGAFYLRSNRSHHICWRKYIDGCKEPGTHGWAGTGLLGGGWNLYDCNASPDEELPWEFRRRETPGVTPCHRSALLPCLKHGIIAGMDSIRI